MRKRREVFVSKCRVWKLKEADVHRNFQEKINAKADAKFEGDVENLWMKLKERLLEVADEVCGRAEGPLRHREWRWWNEEVAKVMDEKRRLFSMWKKSNSEEDRVLCCIAKRNARKTAYVPQADDQKVFAGMLDLEFEQGTVFRVVKQMVGKNRDIVGAGCVKGPDGKLVTGEAEVKDRWQIYYDKLLNEEFEWNKVI